MSKRALAVWIAVACAFAARAGAEAERRSVPQALKVCPLMGRVVDQLGRPLKGVSLRATPTGAEAEAGPRPAVHALSQDGGSFSLCVEPGEVEVELSLPCATSDCGEPSLGHAVHRVVVAPEGVSRRTELVLPVGGLLAGRVLDAEGQPVPWASVFAPPLRWPAPSIGDRADEDGRFRFDRGLVPVGRQAVGVRHPEHGDLDVWVQVEAGLNELELRMPAPLATCARVLDDADEPIGGAEVLLVEPPLLMMPRYRSTSAADGHAHLVVPKAGLFYLEATKDGYLKGRTRPYLIADEEAAPCRELTLQRAAATVIGQVTWAEGVEPEPLRASFSDAGPVEVDRSTGEFTLRNVPPGTGTLSLRAVESTRRVSVPVEVPAGASEVPVEVVVERGHDFEVRVLQDEEPVAERSISLQSTSSRGWWSGSTDEEGVVRFVGLPPGDYLLEPGRPSERLVRVPRDEPLVLEMPEAELLVDVVDAEERPVDELHLHASLRGGGLSFARSGDRLDTPGRFRLMVDPGTYVLRVDAPGWVPVERPIELSEAGAEPLRIVLRKGPELTFRVLGAEGSIPRQVQVRYRPEGDWISLGASGRTGPGGEVTITDLPEGEHEIAVSALGYAEARRRVKVPGPVVLFELPLEGWIEIEVPELESATTAVLILRDGRGRLERDWLGRAERTFWPGRVNELEVAAGVWRLEVVAEDGRSWEGEAVVTSGEVTRLRLEGEGRSRDRRREELRGVRLDLR